MHNASEKWLSGLREKQKAVQQETVAIELNDLKKVQKVKNWATSMNTSKSLHLFMDQWSGSWDSSSRMGAIQRGQQS